MLRITARKLEEGNAAPRLVIYLKARENYLRNFHQFSAEKKRIGSEIITWIKNRISRMSFYKCKISLNRFRLLKKIKHT